MTRPILTLGICPGSPDGWAVAYSSALLATHGTARDAEGRDAAIRTAVAMAIFDDARLRVAVLEGAEEAGPRWLEALEGAGYAAKAVLTVPVKRAWTAALGVALPTEPPWVRDAACVALWAAGVLEGRWQPGERLRGEEGWR
ncbi:MAG: hypothetical protein ACOCXM_03220 [Myxococcota bacterium]